MDPAQPPASVARETSETLPADMPVVAWAANVGGFFHVLGRLSWDSRALQRPTAGPNVGTFERAGDPKVPTFGPRVRAPTSAKTQDNPYSECSRFPDICGPGCPALGRVRSTERRPGRNCRPCARSESAARPCGKSTTNEPPQQRLLTARPDFASSRFLQGAVRALRPLGPSRAREALHLPVAPHPRWRAAQSGSHSRQEAAIPPRSPPTPAAWRCR
jgi:hypothetical protein